jgi:hypothetical protein
MTLAPSQAYFSSEQNEYLFGIENFLSFLSLFMPVKSKTAAGFNLQGRRTRQD